MAAADSVGNYEDDFKNVETYNNQFRSGFLDIKMVNKEEAQKIVTAICEADEDERADASRDASSRAQAAVLAQYNNLKKLKDDTEKAINTASSSLKAAKANGAEYKKNGDKIDKYLSKLNDLSEKLQTNWLSVDKMTIAIRANNHPVVSWMKEAGQAAHDDRQKSQRFLAKEVSVGSAGRIDCLAVNGNELVVVELKPCNDRAKSKARKKLGDYINELMNNWTRKYKAELVKKNAAFNNVTKISGRCDCYTLCPIITDEGEYEKAYLKWTEGVIPSVPGGNLK